MNTLKLTTILIMMSLLFFSAGCVGEELTAEQIAEECKEKQANIEDFSTTLHMTTYMDDQEITAIYSMTQKMPNKTKMVSIEAEQGEGRVIVSNGETMWTYKPDRNSVMVMNMSSMEGFDASQMDYTGMIQSLLDENDATLEGTEAIDGRNCYIINLKPNGEKQHVVSFNVKAWIDKETWVPIKLEMYDDEGNMMVETEYRDFKVNTGIPDSTFEFEIPEGAEVVSYDDLDELLPEQIILEEAQELSEYHVLVPTYIPEGYELESATFSDNTRFFGEVNEMVSITYLKDNENIHISEMFHEEEAPAIADNIGEMVDVNDHEAHILVSEMDEQFTSITWIAGNNVISIYGPLNQDEIIKIAESME